MAEKRLRIALAGNPNCGKTLLFNVLTGSNQYVGNWPGVTVEKKEGKLKGESDVVIQDLPGIYSLSPCTPEEVVSRKYLVDEHPDAILNIIDGTNIERNLYLTTQLIELGHPVVVAVNMMDLVRKNGDSIDTKKLGEMLHCEVIEISALKGEGCFEAAKKAVMHAKNHTHGDTPHVFNGSVEHALAHIEESIEGTVKDNYLRWYAIKIFERDEMVLNELKIDKDLLEHIELHISDCEKELDDDAESIIADQRYTYIERVVGRSVKKKRAKHGMTLSDKIDRIVTNRILALPIFAAVMFLMYAIAMGSFKFSIGTMGTDWANDVLFGEWVPNLFDRILTTLNVSDWLYDLIINGILAGVGAVLGFVPQILVLCFLLAILEDVGYMSRVAFIMDRILRKFGLSGKSIIPMLVATGCGVPGILASRTIEQERDRKITIMTTGFIPCGAKMPIIGLFAGAVFGNSPLVATSAFFIGVAAVVISGVILKKFKALAGKPAPFVMELPNYRMPGAKNVGHLLWDKAKDFLQRAFTVIFLATLAIWFLQTFDMHLNIVTDSKDSILAMLAGAIAPVFKPMGFGDWRISTALITGFMAKESVVSTLSVLFGSTEALLAAITPLAAASLLVFCLLYTPCVAAIAAIKRELGGKWAVGVVVGQCVIAWVAALAVYLIGGIF